MRELTIVVNTMSGQNGDVLECARNYAVKRGQDGMVIARFKNENPEDWSVKMTLTALIPKARFEVSVGNTVQEYRISNSAGILECRLIVPSNRVLTVSEIRSESDNL